MKNEWISVKDRLPTVYTFCWVYDADGYTQTAYLTDGTDAVGNVIVYFQEASGSSCSLIDNVTHWMPLPEPPKI